MAISISTNVQSLVAQNSFLNTSNNISKSLERLSSGKRINSAVDDPAGLAISTKIEVNLKSLERARKNAMDGISALQVAEGSMSAITDTLIRMRELTVQASNGTLSNQDRMFLNNETQQLIMEINRIAESTKFNGVSLVSGAFSVNGLVLQIGVEGNSTGTITVTLPNIGTDSLGSISEKVVSQISLSSSAGQARAMLKYIDAAIEDIAKARSELGSQVSRLNVVINQVTVNFNNLSAAKSRILDTDIAEETAKLTSNQILSQAGISVIMQANQVPQMALALIQG